MQLIRRNFAKLDPMFQIVILGTIYMGGTLLTLGLFAILVTELG